MAVVAVGRRVRRIYPAQLFLRRVAYLPIAEYEEWALKNGYFGEKEIPVMVGDEEIGFTKSDVNYENYNDYYCGWGCGSSFHDWHRA